VAGPGEESAVAAERPGAEEEGARRHGVGRADGPGRRAWISEKTLSDWLSGTALPCGAAALAKGGSAMACLASERPRALAFWENLLEAH
jgi:hypothetical protein